MYKEPRKLKKLKMAFSAEPPDSPGWFRATLASLGNFRPVQAVLGQFRRVWAVSSQLGAV